MNQEYYKKIESLLSLEIKESFDNLGKEFENESFIKLIIEIVTDGRIIYFYKF